MVSPLRAAIDFLQSFGFFDIILPFILVFTIVFAILEKTKILGKEEAGKRNVNALVAFAFGLFVVAATNIVDTLSKAIPVITLVLIILISFMILVGAFHGDKEFDYFSKNGFWRWFLTIVMFIAVVLIFMNFTETDDGDTWLEAFWDYVTDDLDSGPVVSSILFLAIIIFVVYFVGYGGKDKESDK